MTIPLGGGNSIVDMLALSVCADRNTRAPTTRPGVPIKVTYFPRPPVRPALPLAGEPPCRAPALCARDLKPWLVPVLSAWLWILLASEGVIGVFGPSLELMLGCLSVPLEGPVQSSRPKRTFEPSGSAKNGSISPQAPDSPRLFARRRTSPRGAPPVRAPAGSRWQARNGLAPMILVGSPTGGPPVCPRVGYPVFSATVSSRPAM